MAKLSGAQDMDTVFNPKIEGQAGPLMVRHIIDGHEVLLPADAKLHKPLKPGDEIDDHPLSGTY